MFTYNGRIQIRWKRKNITDERLKKREWNVYRKEEGVKPLVEIWEDLNWNVKCEEEKIIYNRKVKT